ncbi:MAG: VOC family protein [Armatimonadetes bacterium]|nr:VOC family protein [Armatimonadota bacterium]
MSERTQTIVPMLSYEDGEAMMDWLIRAFGCEQKERWVEGGRLTHGELQFGDQVVMLASPSPDYQSPRTVQKNYPPAAEWSKVPYIFNGVLVYVADVEAHFARAKAAGATILSEIETGFPGPRYRAEDPEGQRWFFLQIN